MQVLLLLVLVVLVVVVVVVMVVAVIVDRGCVAKTPSHSLGAYPYFF